MNLRELIERKKRDIQHDRYQIVIYDEKGRRVFTDYILVKPTPEDLMRYYEYMKRFNPEKMRKAKVIIVIERKFVNGVILE